MLTDMQITKRAMRGVMRKTPRTNDATNLNLVHLIS